MITRMSLTSIRHLVLSTMTILAATSIVYADPVTINSNGFPDPDNALKIVITAGGPTSFSFQNETPFFNVPRATDFHVRVVNGLIGNGSGGDPFPVSVTPESCQVEGGGTTCMEFLTGPGGGIIPGGTYTFSFIGFPVGTEFHVWFSALVREEVVFYPPKPVGTPDPPTTGSVSAVPEPATMLLLGTGLAGVICKMRKRLKSRETR